MVQFRTTDSSAIQPTSGNAMALLPYRISSSDIKDKSQLMEARKSVERQMERFKVPCHGCSTLYAKPAAWHTV